MNGMGGVWPAPTGVFFALFIAAVARFNSGVATLHIQPIQSLDAPELALYRTLRRVKEQPGGHWV
jgi:hypothetical protein